MDDDALAAKLKALADPVRLAMLEFLRHPVQSCCVQDDGVCACDFETFFSWVSPSRPSATI
jgi:ArsR family transcriptional regulator